jgi:quinol monooxygenase YgiN
LSKVILQGHIIVPDTDLPVVKKELVIHQRLTREEAGCLQFDVFQDSDNANKFNVYEEFVDQQAFNNHQLRVKSSSWGVVTVNVERHYQISNNE